MYNACLIKSLAIVLVLTTIVTISVAGNPEIFPKPGQIFCSLVRAATGVEFDFPPYKCSAECPELADGNVEMLFKCQSSVLKLMPYIGCKCKSEKNCS